MKTVYKYVLNFGVTNELSLPTDAEFLKLGEQNEELVAWFLVDTGRSEQPRFFEIYGTGHGIMNPNAKYLDSFQMQNGLVWHVFDQG